MSGFRKTSVFVRDRFAGILSETESGYRFQYDPAYLDQVDQAPVSLTVPLQKEPHKASVLLSFFDGLIPEGWLLHIVSKNWKFDSNDRFGLLPAACRDCVGAVRIMETEK